MHGTVILHRRRHRRHRCFGCRNTSTFRMGDMGDNFQLLHTRFHLIVQITSITSLLCARYRLLIAVHRGAAQPSRPSNTHRTRALLRMYLILCTRTCVTGLVVRTCVSVLVCVCVKPALCFSTARQKRASTQKRSRTLGSLRVRVCAYT